ncbi:MAG: hypothetical protein ACFCU1_03350 [Sumerlaeia bacterium]
MKAAAPLIVRMIAALTEVAALTELVLLIAALILLHVAILKQNLLPNLAAHYLLKPGLAIQSLRHVVQNNTSNYRKMIKCGVGDHY